MPAEPAPTEPARLRAVPDRPPTVHYAEAVRTVGALARRRGWAVPAFVSPPRVPGVDRSIRRRRDGGATVAVRLLGRPVAAVRADVIDGVIAANAVDARTADRFRRAAWAALDGGGPRTGGHRRSGDPVGATDAPAATADPVDRDGGAHRVA